MYTTQYKCTQYNVWSNSSLSMILSYAIQMYNVIQGHTVLPGCCQIQYKCAQYNVKNTIPIYSMKYKFKQPSSQDPVICNGNVHFTIQMHYIKYKVKQPPLPGSCQIQCKCTQQKYNLHNTIQMYSIQIYKYNTRFNSS